MSHLQLTPWLLHQLLMYKNKMCERNTQSYTGGKYFQLVSITILVHSTPLRFITMKTVILMGKVYWV
jgi:hypothetical protein